MSTALTDYRREINLPLNICCTSTDTVSNKGANVMTGEMTSACDS